MRVSLRATVVMIVAAINVAVFGAGLAWLTAVFADQRQEVESAYATLLSERLQQLLDSRGNLKASPILRWTYWNRFEDALIVRLPALGTDRDAGARGVFLNPLGASHRPADFPLEDVLADVRRAAREGREISSAGGVAVPVLLPTERVWGGCWFLPKWSWSAGALLHELLPWFAVSTLLLTAGTFAALNRLVLEPVRALAHGASRVGRGDLSARVPETGGAGEVRDLVGRFNEMADQVQGFNARLAREVEDATAQAREAEAAAMTQRRLAAMGELAAGIAHEINNPLGGMLNAVEVLQRGEVDAVKRERYLGLLAGGIERIGQTVGRILRLAPREVPLRPVHLARPLEDALGLVAHRARAGDVAIRLRSGSEARELSAPDAFAVFDDLPPILGSPNELGQAILNVLVNALDAIEGSDPTETGATEPSPRGNIEIRMDRTAEGLALVIEDDGPGLGQPLLERAPDLFFTTKEPGRGTGLGLAIVHNVVRGHAGRVRLASRPGSGFRVEIVLPVAGPQPSPPEDGKP